jgi:predicted amidohydrolase
MKTWRIAGVQMGCRFADVPSNLASIRERLRQAAAGGARLVVFPECVLTGYGFASREEALAVAESIPGPTSRLIADDCAALGVWAALGMLERDGERLFNACALVGPGGEIHPYRKVHLPLLGVDRFVTPGDRPFEVFDLGGLKVGMTICYDGSFPEASRALALLGADVILLPTNWPTGARASVLPLTVARAIENHVYYCAVNRIGEERGFRYIGCSRVVDFNGALAASSSADAEEILFADLDPEAARQKQIVIIPGEYEVNRVGHRRPEMYGPLINGVRKE